jgi:hypothetical protein
MPRRRAATGRWYAQAIGLEFGVQIGGDQGIQVGGYDGRGDDNVKHTDMPAILLEPLFVSNPAHAEIVLQRRRPDAHGAGPCRQHQEVLSGGRADRIQRRPQVKTSSPDDGAPVVGGGSEAEFAEKVLLKAETMLHEIAVAVAGVA